MNVLTMALEVMTAVIMKMPVLDVEVITLSTSHCCIYHQYIFVKFIIMYRSKTTLLKCTWTALYLYMKILSMSVWVMVIPSGIIKIWTDIKTGFHEEIQSRPSPFCQGSFAVYHTNVMYIKICWLLFTYNYIRNDYNLLYINFF